MIIKKMLSSKLQLLAITAMLSVSLINVQTAYGYATPGGNSNRVTPVIPRPGTLRPGPIIPRPGYPRPEYPRPGYPGPVVPGPIYPPIPPYYPPTYPGPIYPGPIYPAPNYTEYKTAYVNRYVYNETMYASQLMGYNYSGYRLKSVHINISGSTSASVSLVVNGQVVDSKYSSGQDIYLYPGYYADDLGSEIGSLGIHINGSAYIYSMVFELERRY